MKFKHFSAVVLVVTIFISSCTPYKNVPYFQDLKKNKIYKEKIDNFSPLTIQAGDILDIHVTSLNHDADAPFNYNLQLLPPNVPANVDKADQNAVVGYPVDQQGNIHIHLVGAVKVAGSNTAQIAADLEEKLSEYLSKPTVQVRIQNFKVSVLGDVAHPGVYSSLSERFTVTDAIAYAGDLNTTGIRDSVMLIREIDGNREYVPLNLTSKKIFSSPYFYLKNNDVIYVQPNRDRVSQSDSGVIKISLIISALSVLALFLTRVN